MDDLSVNLKLVLNILMQEMFDVVIKDLSII